MAKELPQSNDTPAIVAAQTMCNTLIEMLAMGFYLNQGKKHKKQRGWFRESSVVRSIFRERAMFVAEGNYTEGYKGIDDWDHKDPFIEKVKKSKKDKKSKRKQKE